jgi:hypothetical protein
MRSLTAALGLTILACTFGPVSAAPGFSDGLCPEATQYVLAVGKLSKDDPPQRVYDTAQAATDAYQRCAKEKLSNGSPEGQHYANTRGSSFAVLAARTLLLLNRHEDARRELEYWRPLAQQVVDWRSGAMVSGQGHAPDPRSEIQTDVAGASRGDHRESRYRDSAKDIVVAIDAELARIDAVLHDRPRAPGHGTPEPAPSAHP